MEEHAMHRMHTLRRLGLALLASLVLAGTTVAQVLANNGNGPFPR
jgi:hypothetical protein